MDLYQYKIKFYIEDEDREDYEIGLVIAKNYNDAVHKLEETYGKYIDELFLKLEGVDHEVIVVPEKLMSEVLECNQW